MDHCYDSDTEQQSSSELFQERQTEEVTDQTVTDSSGVSGRYTGSIDILNKKPHGEGRMVYSNQTYDGQWIDGDWSGFGTHTDDVSGEVYEGGFFDNRRNGHGVLNYPDGRVYDGAFVMNEMGKGKMTYQDGSVFWGHFNSEAAPHGRGKFSFPDGSVYDGEFEDGVIQGHGRMTWKDGRWYLGEWSHGEKNGLGIEVRADGSICHEGTFANGSAVTGSSFSGRRRSNEGFILYPSSRTLGKTNTLIGPIPKQSKDQPRRSSIDMGSILGFRTSSTRNLFARSNSKRSLVASEREHPMRSAMPGTMSQ